VPSVVPTYTFTIPPGEGSHFLGAPQISPDGTRVAVVSEADGNRGIEVFHLDSGTSQKIANTGNAAAVSWSPDSRFLAFVDRLELKRADLMGGPPVKICDFPPGNGAPFTSWNTTGTILFTGRDGLYAASVSGGTPKRLTTVAATGPQFLPDGKHFLYWSNPNTGDVQGGTIYLGSLDSPPERNQAVVMTRASAPIFGRDRANLEYLLIARDDALIAVRFDVSTLKPTESPIAVAPQIGTNGPVPGVSVSGNGTMVYSADTSGGRSTIQYAWFDRKGTRLAAAGQPVFYREFSLSPDESQVAVAISDRTYDSEIYVMDVKGTAGRPVRITFDPEQNRSPVWSPDGMRVVFSRVGVGLIEKFVKTGAERVLVREGGRPSDWSRQGTIVYSLDDDIMFLTDGKPSRFSANKTPAVEQHAHLSPDGTLLAYTSSDSRNVYDVYAETVPQSSFKQQVAEGGFQPRWRRDGRELYYIRYADARLIAVPVTPGATIPFGAPVELFTLPTSGVDRGYAVSGNGERFLIPTIAPAISVSPITVVTNWAPTQ
jgi:Tol biopolymer transport system component